MNKEVYRYVLGTYGRSPVLWLGMAGVLFQLFVIRVYVVIILAQVGADVAVGNFAGAKHLTLVYLLSYLVAQTVGTAGETMAIKAEDRRYDALAVAFHRKLINKDISFYRDSQTGYLAGMFRQHLDGMMELVRFWRGEALGTVLSLVVPTIVLLVVAPPVGAAAIAVVALQLVYVMWASGKASEHRKVSHEIYRRLTGEISDEITNITAFKSGGIEAHAYKKVGRLVREESRAFELRRLTVALLDFPRGVLTAMGISLAVYLVITSSSGRSGSALGLIVLTLTYMFQITRTVATLPELITTHDDRITKVHPTLRYLGSDYETIRDPAKPQKLTVKKGQIELRNVGFSYPAHSKHKDEIPVFSDLNLRIAGGEQLGVVGLSGAGKSTLASLLLRFDEVKGGSITIDGIDIRQVRQSELRQKIAYVPQEPLLFHRSIKENIAYFAPRASQAEIVQAAKAAHAHGFISKLPDGYDTTVGERGVKLSGGQKQRIAIARAILKKAPIMLLDEATSALDSESEQIIQRALPQILGRQTAVVIAHRLSTIARLDRIIVMHEGKIAEEGTHRQLLRAKGRYYSLWQKQTAMSQREE